jgi:DNA invertase Pin-like site-specific DNA recombinase
MDQTFNIPERNRPGAAFLVPAKPSRRSRRDKPVDLLRRQKIREQTRQRQARHEQNAALRGDPSINTIGRALVAVLVDARPEEKNLLRPVLRRMFEKLAATGYQPRYVARRLKNARRRMRANKPSLG